VRANGPEGHEEPCASCSAITNKKALKPHHRASPSGRQPASAGVRANLHPGRPHPPQAQRQLPRHRQQHHPERDQQLVRRRAIPLQQPTHAAARVQHLPRPLPARRLRPRLKTPHARPTNRHRHRPTRARDPHRQVCPRQSQLPLEPLLHKR
jgi:hypothetical protein